jgi:hypothetical protein
VLLEHAFGEIEANGGNLHRERLLFCGVIQRRPRQPLNAVQQAPSTPSSPGFNKVNVFFRPLRDLIANFVGSL